MGKQVKYFPAAEEMYDEAAKLICKAASEALVCSGGFSLVLSGGETPLPLYRRLPELALPWERTDFFWADERCVDRADERSNYANAAGAFLNRVPLLAENIHGIKTELSPEAAAVNYAEELTGFKKRTRREKLFDLVLLGMGGDGHTASLFPGSEALNEHDKLVVAVPPPETVKPAVARVTLTFPALADSKMVLFMIKGEKKKALLESKNDFPAKMVKSGKVIWFIT
ncbi:MAG: 6-phosphogluconolactonase [Victivallaceae bacterium]|nr:6-phosphogluconolactonase [Victivallaceae bacterium]